MDPIGIHRRLVEICQAIESGRSGVQTLTADDAARLVGQARRAARTAGVIGDVWRASRGDVADIERRQQRRLRALVDCARTRSPYYRAALRGLPASAPVRLADLPWVSKTEMMLQFDDWVTDPAVTRAGVQEFLSDPTRVGEAFVGRYLVTTTSGSTGSPAIVLFDAQARGSRRLSARQFPCLSSA